MRDTTALERRAIRAKYVIRTLRRREPARRELPGTFLAAAAQASTGTAQPAHRVLQERMLVMPVCTAERDLRKLMRLMLLNSMEIELCTGMIDL